MNAEKAEVGKRYLSKTGVPVTVTERRGDKTVLRVDVSGNKVEVAKDYPLFPYKESKVSKESKALVNSNGKKGRQREGSLAAIIDPMLFAGTKTVKEIAAELAKKAGASAKGKDLEANVRARMVCYKRKGYCIEKDEKKHIKIIQSKG